MTASASPSLKSPYPLPAYSASRSGTGRPVATEYTVSRFEIAGLSSRSTISRPESVTAVFTFLRRTSGGSVTLIVPCGESADFDILAVGSWKSMTRAPPSAGGMSASGTTNVSRESRVEAHRDVARQLEVLALVVADRHLVGPVQQDVGRHQHRVVEQAGRHEGVPPLRRLVLELCHAAQLAVRRERVEDPGQLRVLVHLRLREQDRAPGIDAGGQVDGGEIERLGAQLVGVGQALGDRVQVDDAEHALIHVLGQHEAPERADVVAQVDLARGLDSREHPCHLTTLLRRDAEDSKAGLALGRSAYGAERLGLRRLVHHQPEHVGTRVVAHRVELCREARACAGSISA